MRDESESSPALDGPVAPNDPAARIRLTRGGALLLTEDGFRLVQPRGLKRSPIHPWDTITHVWAAERALLIGTEETVLQIRARDFADPDQGPVALGQLYRAGRAQNRTKVGHEIGWTEKNEREREREKRMRERDE